MGKAVFNLAALDKLEGLRDDFNTQLAAAVRDC